jgi:hypothetical protein
MAFVVMKFLLLVRPMTGFSVREGTAGLVFCLGWVGGAAREGEGGGGGRASGQMRRSQAWLCTVREGRCAVLACELITRPADAVQLASCNGRWKCAEGVVC